MPPTDPETWRCPGCRDTTAPMGMCQKCGVFGLRYEPADPTAALRTALTAEQLQEAVLEAQYRFGRLAKVPIEFYQAVVDSFALASRADDPSGPDVEWAWNGLLDCRNDTHGETLAQDIAHHRPIIEAAIRAESVRTDR